MNEKRFNEIENIAVNYLMNTIGEISSGLRTVRQPSDLDAFVPNAIERLKEGLRKLHETKLTKFENRYFNSHKLAEVFRVYIKALTALQMSDYNRSSALLDEGGKQLDDYRALLRSAGKGRS
ncbi:hypothetical protein [Bacillus sp. CBEL-1]|uniref:hypothetical protein n=1 Tax=Bacillus sp. CBEL-1 TaxID=2502980 RepID=UPI001045F874|nr:hypothetical protein [Bacillus sp. CBEL-1]TDB51749.1 hypothetical protein EPL02_08350 [Bacillus sp. CBEL-1]